VYFTGNSLGLQPKKARQYIEEDLETWKKVGVIGHFTGKHPWLTIDECVTKQMAKIVGANESEIAVMNTLTVNLHLMMVHFYRPTATRHKILIEDNPFPSDWVRVIEVLVS
jgi:kynureninase